MSSKSVILRRLMSVALVLALTAALLPVAPPAAGAAELSAGNQFLAPIAAPDPNAIKIYTAQQLSDIRNNLSGSYALMNDIDLSGFNGGEWIPIGSGQSGAFTGIFDGQGHVIRNLKITGSPPYSPGLFGYVSDGVIKNTGMVATKIDVRTLDGASVGGIVGSSRTLTIENCYNTGSVSVIDFGVADVSSADFFFACAGGIVGYSRALTIENCYNTGVVSAAGDDAITNAGGIVGFYDTLTIKNCYNTGAVSAVSDYGNAGGILGFSYYSGYDLPDSTFTIENCYNTGAVAATGGHGNAGGILGSSDLPNVPLIVESCYNTGAVYSGATDSYAGGIVGSYWPASSDATLSIKDSYYINNVSKSVGSNDDRRQPILTNTRSLTASEMRQQSSFEGFDFDAVWIMADLPQLRSRFAPGSATPALSAVPAASTASGSGAGSAVRLTIDDKKMIVGDQTVTMDVAPYIENNYTMVPVSYVAKALGLASDGVTWDGAALTVTIKTGDRTAVLTIGSAEFSLNGAVVSIPTAPALRDNRAFLPFRVLGEQVLGVKVGWDNVARTATLGG